MPLDGTININRPKVLETCFLQVLNGLPSGSVKSEEGASRRLFDLAGESICMVVASAVVFLASLLIGALGIYLGARIIVGAGNYDHALVTALIGAVVWAVVGFFVGWIPLLGPALALLAYITVINFQYPGDWTAAAMIGLVAG